MGRYQAINEGPLVEEVNDMANEIKIITLRDEIFDLWSEFITLNSTGGLMDPDTLEPFNVAKKFKRGAQNELKREFFRHLGHFKDGDLHALVLHLLNRTPHRELPYPKVSLRQPSGVHSGLHVCSEWVERRKKKRVIMEEIMSIDPSLSFFTNDGEKDVEAWRKWKTNRKFSSATWNILFGKLQKEFFTTRLTNKGIFKRAKDLTKEFPQVLSFFQTFFHHKNNVSERVGPVQLRDMDMTTFSIDPKSWRYKDEEKLQFGLVDLRDVIIGYKGSFPGEEPAIFSFFRAILDLDCPLFADPPVWLWIASTDEMATDIVDFVKANILQFEYMKCTYTPSKAERIYDSIPRLAEKHVVQMIFLFKKDNDHAKNVREKVKSFYQALDIPYYISPKKFDECKWRISDSELRMEFYFEILNVFTEPGDAVLGVLTGTKFMLACQVCFL